MHHARTGETPMRLRTRTSALPWRDRGVTAGHRRAPAALTERGRPRPQASSRPGCRARGDVRRLCTMLARARRPCACGRDARAPVARSWRYGWSSKSACRVNGARASSPAGQRPSRLQRSRRRNGAYAPPSHGRDAHAPADEDVRAPVARSPNCAPKSWRYGWSSKSACRVNGARASSPAGQQPSRLPRSRRRNGAYAPRSHGRDARAPAAF
jgi:hypothetical protein